jgi:septal ring factor EnvC (AmiA/AmiB activator)
VETTILTAEVNDLHQEMRLMRDQITKLTNTNQRLTADLAASNSALTSLAAQSQQAVSYFYLFIVGVRCEKKK